MRFEGTNSGPGGDVTSVNGDSAFASVRLPSFLRNVVDCTPFPAFIVAGDRFVYGNAAFVDLAGVPADEVSRLSFLEFVHPDDRERLRRLAQRHLTGDEAVFDYTCRAVAPNGKVFRVRLRTAPVDLEGRRGVFGAAWEVTPESEVLGKARERVKHLQGVIDALDVGVMVVDPGTHTVLDVNRVALQLLRRSRDEVIGRECFEFVCPSERGRCPVTDLGQTLDRSEQILVDVDGRHIPIIKTVTRLRGRNGAMLLVETFRDIRHERELEETLDRELIRHRILVNLLRLSLRPGSVADFVRDALDVVLDVPWLSIERRGAIFLTHPHFSDSLVVAAGRGIPRYMRTHCAEVRFGSCLCGRAAMLQEMQFASTVDLRHRKIPEDAPEHGHYCVPIVDSGQTLGVLNLYTPAGVSFSGRDLSFLTAIADTLALVIRRRRNAEETRLLQETLEYTGTGVLVADGEERVVHASAAACRLLGLPAEDLLGRRLSGVVRRIGGRDDMRDLLDGIRQRRRTTRRVRRRIGEAELVWQLEVTPLSAGEKGASSGVALMVRDVTEQAEAEAREERARRLEAIGQLAGGIAHDFNNMLMVILNAAVMAEETLPADHPGLDYIKSIRDAAQRSARLTKEMLAYARRQPLMRETIDLQREIRRVIDAVLRHTIPENIMISCSMPPDPVLVSADPAQIQHVLMNLALNARDAMPQGGRITIRLALRSISTPIEPKVGTVVPSGRYAVIDFEDTGGGIPEEVLPRIFEPFFTTKAVGKGTGMGLPSVLGMIQQHGGALAVESRPGRGTTFSLYLPILREGASAESPSRREEATSRTEDGPGGQMSPKPAQAKIGEGRSALVLEDNEAVRELLKRQLQVLGFTVLCADSAKQALAVFEGQGAVDVVVTDVVMPGESGPQIVERLRRLKADLPVLMMSGYPKEEVLMEEVDNARTRFLSKPVAFEVLEKTLCDLLEAGDGE